MITDQLKTLYRYKALFPELYNYLLQNDINSLGFGKHEISDTLFVLVNEYETNTNDIDILENHLKYIDFQIILAGSEKVALANSYISMHKQYDNEADYELVKAHPFFLNFTKNSFMVFYPNEYHRPGIIASKPEKVKKIVFKMKI